MNYNIAEYNSGLYISAAAAAFFRDSIPGQFQLHWHFAGKCEGLLYAKVMTLEEVSEKLSEANVAVGQLFAENTWREWNQAYGRIDGFAEIVAAAQSTLADAAEPAASEVKLLREGSRPEASEYLQELINALTRAHRYGAACAKGRPLHCYFEGKAKALRCARSATLKGLAEEFEVARYRAHREVPDSKECQYQRGLSAGFAEAAALAKLTRASRSTTRA